MKKKNIIAVLVAVVVIIAAVLLVSRYLKARTPILLQGTTECTTYKASSKIAGRIVDMKVEEGQRVERGELLYTLSTPELDAKLQQAEAVRSAASAIDQKVLSGARVQQIEAALNMWQQAQAGRELAQKTFDRVKALYEQGVVPAQKFDEAQARYEAAAATERAARAQYDMAVNGARREDRLAAEAQVSRARGAIAEVTSYLNETILTASDDGLVTEIFPEVGELVGTGAPIMNVARMDDVWFTFNIREDLLPGIAVGRELTAYLPALGIAVPVRITRMKDVGSFAVWKATKALDRFDLKTFEVRARPVSPVEGLHPGMSAVLRKSEIE